ncbi:uncharacterized protein LOC120991994 [Bufo bufo]|uniref:uncharacterized protein LOC120991994 n=1 Tax=Bufo bufo TaxID=8384 RepID=UPI001ABE14E2|nr:uncharacterized protein LOC120991994 [Bufo bufo]
MNPGVSIFLELLSFVLSHNYFTFWDAFYLQLQATAMGAVCAPSFANLFLGLWEREVFLSDTILGVGGVQLCARYIDDIFIVWQGPRAGLAQLMGVLNDNALNIKLSHRIEKTCLDFLDVKISVDDGGRTHTDLFRKETSTNAVLHANSSHLKNLVHSIPYGQFLRARRICSTDESFESQSDDLREIFQARGYTVRSINEGYNKAKHKKRDDLLLAYRKQRDNRDEQVRFISSYNLEWRQMRQALTKYWEILRLDPHFEQGSVCDSIDNI